MGRWWQKESRVIYSMANDEEKNWADFGMSADWLTLNRRGCMQWGNGEKGRGAS